MKPPFHIETLNRAGEVLQRQLASELPITLGRGYDNQIILDDPHAGAHHALIEAYDDEHLMLRDLGSRNGTIHRGRRHSSVILGGDTVVRLGHTQLRVRGANHPVPPELEDTGLYGWEGARPAVAGLVLIALVTFLANWLTDVQGGNPANTLLVLAATLGGAVAWGAAWAVANRIFGGAARFGRHLFILGCGFAAVELWRLLSRTAAYAWSIEPLTAYGSHMMMAIACCMVFFHLRTIKPQHPRGFAGVCLALLGLGSGLMLVSNLQSSGRLADQLYMSVLAPPALRLSADHTVNDFFGQAAGLKAKVDAERGKAGDAADDSDDE